MRILNRVLGALERVYRFEGPQTSVDQVDLAGPVQLVHDVSRQAELGRGPGTGNGYNNFSLQVSHAASLTGYANQPLNASALFWGSQQVTPQDFDLWLIESTLRVQATNAPLVEAFLSISQSVITGSFTDHVRPLARWNSSSTAGIAVAGSNSVPAFRTEAPVYCVNYPVLLPPDSTFYFFSSVTNLAAMNIGSLCQLLVYIAPKGTLPPGMA